MVGREIELVGGGDDELCSDVACGDESYTGDGTDDNAGSPSFCKVGLVVSPMMAPVANVGVVGNPSND